MTLQEANKTFGKINEALRKLEAKSKVDASDPEGSSLQLLRDDLGVQGDTLSTAIQGLCSDIRSTSLHASGSSIYVDVRPVAQHFLVQFDCGPKPAIAF